MKKKKKNAVAFGFTKNHVGAVACVMLDLKKFDKKNIDEVVLFHDGISVSDKNKLKQILPCRFIKYKFPIKDTSQFSQGSLHYFSLMLYSKYEIFQMLDFYENIIFLDYDIVIKSSISSLFIRENIGLKLMTSETKVSTALTEPIRDYDMNAMAYAVGLIVAHDNLNNYHEIYKWCYDATKKYAKYLYLPEQAIFDFMLEEFKIKPTDIDPNIFCCYPTDSPRNESAIILHAWGQPKFWNGLNNKQWEENYLTWVKMGGSRITENKKRNIYQLLHKIIRSIIK